MDNPAEVGLTGLFYASCVNAWWYNACRTLENLALLIGDETIAARALSIIRKLEKSYTHYFYNEKVGYLRSAVDRNLRIPISEVFHNSCTIGLDYPYFRYLLRHELPRIGEYQAKKLYHPWGHTAVSFDSELPCEMWRSVHMNQHLGHETKLARLSGDTTEGFRIMERYLEKFDQYKNAIETFNYDGCSDDVVQCADWQAFSATGAYHAIYQGLAGIAWHRGGLHYLASKDNHEIIIKGFRFNNQVWNLHFHGSGKYVRTFMVNGQKIKGSLQIPVGFSEGNECNWVVERSEIPFDRPTLLQADDAQITVLESAHDLLVLQIKNAVHASSMFYTPNMPEVSVNGKTVVCEYERESNIMWFDHHFQADDLVKIRSKVVH